MNKLLILTIMFLSIFSKNWSQSLVINELNVSHFKVQKNPNIHKAHDSDGPFIRISFIIYNDTREDIFFNTESDNLKVTFSYKGEKYSKEMIWESLKELGNMKIPSNSSKEFTTSSHLFLGTNIREDKKYDYTLELLEVLPTLRLNYRDIKLKLVSTGINSVVIKAS